MNRRIAKCIRKGIAAYWSGVVRTSLLVLLFSLSLCTGLTAQSDTSCKDFIRQEMRHYQSLMHYKAQNSDGFVYNVIYNRCEWKVNPARFYLQGGVTTWFVPGYEGFDHISFDFSHVLKVDSVVYHGNHPLFTLDATDVLTISLGKMLRKGQVDSIMVYYQGAPTDGGFNRNLHAGSPVIWTLSEPFEAKGWWPCKQSLNDKIDSIDIIVTTTKPNLAGSNGMLVRTQYTDSFVRYHWRHRYPIAAYLVAIAVTNYSADTEYVAFSPTDSFPVINYFYPENTPALFSQAKQTIPIMQLFIKLAGRYPFDKEKYGHAQFGYGGGMEHQTMSFMTNMGFSLIAHELAHQWFGDKVTCYAWHDIWLNEGFATYFEGLAEEFIKGTDAWEGWKTTNLNWAMQTSDGSVFVADTSDERRIFSAQLSYSKGALLLHMLRFMIGDSSFFKGLRAYLNDANLAYDYARTLQLQKHLEQASGMDLANFFREWYMGQGYPAIEIRWRMEGQHLKLQLIQRPSDPSVSFFHIPVPLRLISSGRDSIIVLQPERNDQTFDLIVPTFPVDQVQADPQRWLMAHYQVRHADSLYSKRIRIFPNPATDKIELELLSTNILSGSYSVFDALGQKCLSGKTSGIITHIDLTALRKGVYYLRFEGGDGIYSEPLLKIR